MWDPLLYFVSGDRHTGCEMAGVTINKRNHWMQKKKKKEYYSGLPFPSPEDLPNPGIEPGSPALQTGSFTIWSSRETWRLYAYSLRDLDSICIFIKGTEKRRIQPRIKAKTNRVQALVERSWKDQIRSISSSVSFQWSGWLRGQARSNFAKHFKKVFELAVFTTDLLSLLLLLCSPNNSHLFLLYFDNSPLGSSVHGILQARILEWVAMPSFRGSSWPRDQTWVFCIAGRFSTIWATREALFP